MTKDILNKVPLDQEYCQLCGYRPKDHLCHSGISADNIEIYQWCWWYTDENGVCKLRFKN